MTLLKKEKEIWLLMNLRDNECETDEFSYEIDDFEQSISFFHQAGAYSCRGIIISNTFSVYGESFKKECEMAYNDFINTYYLIEPKTIHKLDELNI
jgi:hypothetical protein